MNGENLKLMLRVN